MLNLYLMNIVNFKYFNIYKLNGYYFYLFFAILKKNLLRSTLKKKKKKKKFLKYFKIELEVSIGISYTLSI